jgi:hypothetical protein
MRRSIHVSLLPALSLSLVLAFLAGCGGLYPVTPNDVAGEPTVYAKVVKEPNPVLMGHWWREFPPEFEKPDVFEYWLVKKGDRYAVFYNWRGHKENFYGWAPFTINGDEMTSGVEPSRYFVDGGRVYHNYANRALNSPMKKVSE